MANDEMLTDDFVAGLLSQEANDCSLKYSTMGMDEYRSDKKPANMLKPNTRFLRHIIKDTDTHNKALLAKEAAESRARLKDLERTKEMKRRKTNPNARDIRTRQMGDIHAILGGKKRQTADEEASSSSRSRDTKSREKSRRSDQDRHDERKHRGQLARGDDRQSKSDSRSQREERRKRSRSKDSGSEEEDRRRHSYRRRYRSRSPERRRRSRSPKERKSRHQHRSPLHEAKDKPKQQVEEPEDDDSDPLEDLIGPAPPPKYRGRGAVGGSSGIDLRFSETYDPTTDVQMDDDDAGGNWDDAVEAFRDRQKLKQSQEERMRAAGFADEQIQRVKAPKADLADSVQWSKAGEKREWDRGKAVDTDGRLTPVEEF
ncbi:hypothetical protein QQZ08_009524 [Neonectria magnoliae]|uniref:Pre-mRNA-splicing factor 38B n=1 Tax=Neonectria magnoliae TaxID=2732573 RepID=A0ABR1HMT3_9HYPO